MGAAAQFSRVGGVVALPHAEHADLVAVFLAEQGHGARRDGVVGGHQAGRDGLVMADLGVHLGLDRGDVGGGQRAVVREIEAQAVGGDEATLLRDMVAEAVA